MADKEATVYIVDVGKSMGECRNGRSISDLDWAMKYVWDRITTTVATGRKTATIGVVGLRTDGTQNELAEGDDSYSHISIFRPIGQLLMPDLRKLRELIKPSKTDEGDAISSLVIAIQMVNEYTKKLKYKRRIVLVTNGLGTMNTDGLDHIVGKMKEDSIELLVLGTDFDDPEFGFKEEDKDPKKAENEATFRELVEDCDGVYGTVAQAISEMDIPRVKTVRGIPTFKGELRLGNPEQYETAFRIPVERYYRTYVAKPPSASSFVVRSGTTDNQESAQSSATVDEITQAERDQNLTLVRHNRSYHAKDETVENGQRELSRDDLAKGYEYGRTAVHISESDENITKLETYPAMEIIGFIQSENYKRYMNMSTSNVIIAQKTNDEAGLALSSLIHALFELECYAVARLVTKEGKPPLVVLLAPSIEQDFECLLEVQLPFAEDVRSYRFPPLDRVITVSGKTVTEHRNLPKEELMSAMSEYVDSMELDRDGNNEPIDTIPMDDTYSPLLHRIEQAIRYRAINPGEPLPPPSERLTQLSKPPEELQERSKKPLERLIEVADVKKVPPKAQTRKRAREADKPLSGLNVDELLHREKRAKISPQNAIPEFKQTVANAASIEAIKDAADQMEKIIEDHIRNSFGDANYDRVIEELGVVRDEMIAYEEPGVYNAMIRRVKEKILAEKLGGDRKELWWLIRRAKVGLIHRGLSEKSDITEDEAKAFLSSK